MNQEKNGAIAEHNQVGRKKPLQDPKSKYPSPPFDVETQEWPGNPPSSPQSMCNLQQMMPAMQMARYMVQQEEVGSLKYFCRR